MTSTLETSLSYEQAVLPPPRKGDAIIDQFLCRVTKSLRYTLLRRLVRYKSVYGRKTRVRLQCNSSLDRSEYKSFANTTNQRR